MNVLTLSSDAAVGEILDIGFLVQWQGINPATGESWKPVWISRDQCPAEMIARWDARKRATGASLDALKRSASPSTPSTPTDSECSVKRGYEQPSKKPKLDTQTAGRTKNSFGRPTYPGFRPFHQKPKPKAHTIARRTVTPDKLADTPKELQAVAEAGASTHWLLDSAISTKSGMTVDITGSSGGHEDCGWYNGEYEGERGAVLSVFNTGNASFSSTARVKIVEFRDGAPSIFAIPVQYLSPVRPERPGQKALVLDGECKGEVAIIREEGSYENEWFVSARNNHFEISGEKLVLYTEVADTV
ncbi:hypothetical protein DAEQUDRAFT_721415 [Daedalea quercina L-15889]|uniref:Chromo domain-containing protein n=1 Tax=Daedalea quercina L-15889 TaxID=1314783 RepID=A0A165TTE8_9APHY|nr:hypothetical protein DAEQUDRAFT_721415 [Daedalea quercina L-15889]